MNELLLLFLTMHYSSILNIFTVNVFMYSDVKPNFNKSVTTGIIYCNKTFYLFAFWSTNLTYGLLGLLFITFWCCKRQEPEGEDEAQILVQHYHTRILWFTV